MAWGDNGESGVVVKSDGLDSTRSTYLEFICRLIGAAVPWYDIYHLGVYVMHSLVSRPLKPGNIRAHPGYLPGLYPGMTRTRQVL